MTVAAIVLAAGRGTRFGEEPKLLARLAGKSLVRHVAEAAVVSQAEPVVVVTGHRAEEVEAAIGGLGVIVVANPAYADGLATSLKAAFAALPPACEGAVVLLGDMPKVSAALIDRLVNTWMEAGRPVALIPTHGGRGGNPVLLSASLRSEIAALAGDVGAAQILRGRAGVVTLEVDDAAVLEDVDTRDALRRLASR